MAKLKIIWTDEAKMKFYQIAQYYKSQTGNSKYSNKLYRMMKDSLHLAASFPLMYPATSVQETRVFVCEYFKVFYSINKESILVETLFDTRQNPDKLPF